MSEESGFDSRQEQDLTSLLRNVETVTDAYPSSCSVGKGEDKINSVTGREGPEGGWRYSSILSLTSALDGGGRSTPRPSRFTSGKDLVPLV